MAQPSYVSGGVGVLYPAASLAANKNVAVFLDYSSKLEGQVTTRVTTGGTVTANSFTKNESYFCYGSTPLNGSVSAGGTSIVVTSATGFAVGQKIVVENELRTVSAVSGTTLTVDALQNAHTSGVAIYLVESTPTYPGVSSLGGTASTTYARTSFLQTGKWVHVLTNTDASNAVTVELTEDRIDAFV